MIRLHHVPQSRSMRTLWLLHELGVPFDVQVWPFDKSLRSEAFLALNPSGRVPALELDGAHIWETGAITQTLCERFPEAGLGRGPGDTDWLIWVHFAESISQHAAALTQQHIALYEDHMRSAIVMKLEAARLGKCYDALEQRLAGREYLTERFSAADISVGQALYMARHFTRIGTRPALRAWWDRITTRPAYRASLPQDGEPHLYKEVFYEAPNAG